MAKKKKVRKIESEPVKVEKPKGKLYYVPSKGTTKYINLVT